MQLRYQEVATLPSLAWCARVDRGNDAVTVFHGTLVETRPQAFIEGLWNGAFASFDFVDATIVAGTGGVAEPGRMRFSTSTVHLGALFSIAKRGSVYVSNSPAFVLTAAGEELDDAYPFYGYDFVRIQRQGLFCPHGRLRLRSRAKLGVHFMTIIDVDARGRMTFEPHRLGEAPSDFRSYETMLREGTRAVLANGADPARKRGYAPLVPLSRGYDSTAAAVLGKAAGCTEAFSYEDPRRPNPKRDSGASNARFFLDMRCTTYSRWQYLALDRAVEAEFGYLAASCRAPMAGAEAQLPGRVLLLGESGDSIWDPEGAKNANNLGKSWLRRAHGISPIEFRLRVGYQSFAPATIGARHNDAIYRIATSAEMKPWTIGGDYDRPLARRLIEEAGIPRDQFATRKAASGHARLMEPARFSPKGLAGYRQFVAERHAARSTRALDYWKARARWRHRLWDWREKKGGKEGRHVPSTFMQRRFPFLLNATPTRIDWDYAFTFQWAVAEVRERYVLPRSLHP
jgi:hypothetical protein